MLPAELSVDRPYLFSDATVPVPAADLEGMAAVIAAIERVASLPAYRQRALEGAPETARHETRARGVFYGYDFHLSADGPRLIEINTNAGGGLLAARQAQQTAVEEDFVAMFRQECAGPLKLVAIVDEAPTGQFLYPEFVLFQELFERHGIAAVICAPEDLMLCHGGLWCGERRIDLVYNRLTDFSLMSPACTALRQAWLDDSVVVTPHPRGHALYADKRNLTLFSDQALMAAWGVDGETLAVLGRGVPATVAVTADRAEDFWARRRGLFFKPARGYGSKAAYRGDKLTRRVFEEILAADYVAQALVPPSTLAVPVAGNLSELKVDLRCYAYDGRVQLVAARLYQGQTTNFRTPGGGFARVVAT